MLRNRDESLAGITPFCVWAVRKKALWIKLKVFTLTWTRHSTQNVFVKATFCAFTRASST